MISKIHISISTLCTNEIPGTHKVTSFPSFEYVLNHILELWHQNVILIKLKISIRIKRTVQINLQSLSSSTLMESIGYIANYLFTCVGILWVFWYDGTYREENTIKKIPDRTCASLHSENLNETFSFLRKQRFTTANEQKKK